MADKIKLPEDRKKKLISAIQKMEADGVPEEEIQVIVDNYKAKYGVKKKEDGTKDSEQVVQDSGESAVQLGQPTATRIDDFEQAEQIRKELKDVAAAKKAKAIKKQGLSDLFVPLSEEEQEFVRQQEEEEPVEKDPSGIEKIDLGEDSFALPTEQRGPDVEEEYEQFEQSEQIRKELKDKAVQEHVDLFNVYKEEALKSPEVASTPDVDPSLVNTKEDISYLIENIKEMQATLNNPLEFDKLTEDEKRRAYGMMSLQEKELKDRIQDLAEERVVRKNPFYGMTKEEKAEEIATQKQHAQYEKEQKEILNNITEYVFPDWGKTPFTMVPAAVTTLLSGQEQVFAKKGGLPSLTLEEQEETANIITDFDEHLKSMASRNPEEYAASIGKTKKQLLKEYLNERIYPKLRSSIKGFEGTRFGNLTLVGLEDTEGDRGIFEGIEGLGAADRDERVTSDVVGRDMKAALALMIAVNYDQDPSAYFDKIEMPDSISSMGDVWGAVKAGFDVASGLPEGVMSGIVNVRNTIAGSDKSLESYYMNQQLDDISNISQHYGEALTAVGVKVPENIKDLSQMSRTQKWREGFMLTGEMIPEFAFTELLTRGLASPIQGVKATQRMVNFYKRMKTLNAVSKSKSTKLLSGAILKGIDYTKTGISYELTGHLFEDAKDEATFTSGVAGKAGEDVGSLMLNLIGKFPGFKKLKGAKLDKLVRFFSRGTGEVFEESAQTLNQIFQEGGNWGDVKEQFSGDNLVDFLAMTYIMGTAMGASSSLSDRSKGSQMLEYVNTFRGQLTEEQQELLDNSLGLSAIKQITEEELLNIQEDAPSYRVSGLGVSKETMEEAIGKAESIDDLRNLAIKNDDELFEVAKDKYKSFGGDIEAEQKDGELITEEGREPELAQEAQEEVEGEVQEEAALPKTVQESLTEKQQEINEILSGDKIGSKELMRVSELEEELEETSSKIVQEVEKENPTLVEKINTLREEKANLYKESSKELTDGESVVIKDDRFNRENEFVYEDGSWKQKVGGELVGIGDSRQAEITNEWNKENQSDGALTGAELQKKGQRELEIDNELSQALKEKHQAIVKKHEKGLKEFEVDAVEREAVEKLPESEFESKEQLEKEIKEGEWGMLTAENPEKKQLSPEENAELNKKAEAWLDERGYKPQKIVGKYGNVENSYYVPNLTKEDAVAFAKEFNQESVATPEGLVYQDGTMNPRIKGEESFEKQDDFYSTINIKGKPQPFSVAYDFDQKVPVEEVAEKAQQPAAQKKDVRKGVKDRIKPKPKSKAREKVKERIEPKKIKKKNVSEIDKIIGQADSSEQKRALSTIKNVLQTLSRIAPNLEIVLHQDTKSINEAIKETGNDPEEFGVVGGFWDSGDEIHINLFELDSSTVIHEAAHVIMEAYLARSPKAISNFESELRKILPKDDVDSLNEFVSAYLSEDQSEEFVVEALARIANGDINLETMPKSRLAALVDLINKMLRKAGLRDIKLTGKEDVIDFAEKLTSAVETGTPIKVAEKITKGQAYSASGAVKVRGDAEFTPIKKSIQPRKNIPFIKKIPKKTLKDVVKEYKGRIYIITSDATGVGYDSVGDRIDGGVGYLAIDENLDGGIGFASLAPKQARGTVAKIHNRYGSEKVAVLVMVQSPVATVGNFYGGKYFGRGLKALNNKNPKQYSDVVDSIIKFINNNKGVRSEFKKKDAVPLNVFEDLLRNVNNYSEIEFAQEFIKDTTFSSRSKILQSLLIGNETIGTNESTPLVKVLLKEEGFTQANFLIEYGDVGILGKENLLNNKGGFVVGGFELKLPKTINEAKDFSDKKQEEGLTHPQFNGKIPKTGESFYLDGLYPVQENFEGFSDMETRGKEEFSQEIDKIVRKLFKEDSKFESKYRPSGSDKIAKSKRGYRHLTTSNKIKLKEFLKKSNPDYLIETVPQISANVARSMYFSPKVGLEEALAAAEFTKEDGVDTELKEEGKSISPVKKIKRQISAKKGQKLIDVAGKGDDINFKDHLTTDGEGNFLFYHHSPLGKEFVGDKVQPTLKKNVHTSDKRTVPVSYYYATPNFKESEIGATEPVKIVKIAPNRVYPLNTDPLNFLDKAEARFRKKYPNKAFEAPAQADMIGQIAKEEGYEMLVAQWNYKGDSPGKERVLVRAEAQVPHAFVNVVENEVLPKYPSGLNREKARKDLIDRSDSAKVKQDILDWSKEEYKGVYNPFDKVSQEGLKNFVEQNPTLVEQMPKKLQDAVADLAERKELKFQKGLNEDEEYAKELIDSFTEEELSEVSPEEFHEDLTEAGYEVRLDAIKNLYESKKQEGEVGEPVAEEDIPTQEELEEAEPTERKEPRTREADKEVEGEPKRTRKPAVAKTLEEDEEIAEEIKQGVTKKYVQKPLKATKAEAERYINKVGIEQAIEEFLSEGRGAIGRAISRDVEVVIGQTIILSLNKQVLKAKDTKTKKHLIERSIDVADKLAQMHIEAGRMNNAAKAYFQLSAEGQVYNIINTVARARNKARSENSEYLKTLKEAVETASDETIEEVLKSKKIEALVEKIYGKASKRGTKSVSKTKSRKDRITKQAVDFLESLKIDTSGKAMDATYAIPVSVWNGTISVLQGAIKAGVSVSDAINRAAKHVNDNHSGAWDEEGFRKDMSSSFNKFTALNKINEGDIAAGVEKGLKEIGQDINKIARKHFTEQNKAKKDLIDKFIDELGLTETEAKELSASIEKEFSTLVGKKKRTIINSMVKDKPKTVSSKAARQLHDKVIEMSNLGVLSNEDYFDVFSKVAKLPEITPEQATKLNELSEKAQNTPEGFQQDRVHQEILSEHRKIKGIKWTEVGWSLWYGMVLSGFKTQALNIWANSAELFGEFLVSSTQDPRNTALLAKGVLNGMRKGWLESRAILGSKHGSIRGAKIDVPSTLEDIRFKGGAFNPFNYVKYVGRFMDAADTFFFASAKEMRFNQLAAVEARRMKKTDPDISIYKKVSEMLYNDKQGLEDARSAAAAEGLTGLNFKRRVFEIMEQNRDSNMSEDSQDFAARATFNYDPEGSMAIIISAINQLQKIPGFRFIVPFSRIVGNVTNRYLDWTPIGAVRVIKGGIGWGSLMKEYNKEERIRTAIKATISTVLVAALYNFIEDDDDFEITAGGTGDYKKNYELEAGSGWQEYSIRIGDTWYSYKNTPLAIAFAFLGDISDRKKYLGQNDRDVFDSVSGSFLSSGKYIMSQSFLLGFSDFLSIFTDKSKREEFGVKKLLSFPVKSVKGVMIPALFTQSKRFYDEYSGTALKQPTAWYEDIYKDIPFFNDGMGNKYNALGDKVIPDITKDLMPFSMKSAEGDKVFELLTSNGMYVGTPQSTVYKSSSNSSIKLKAEGKEYNKYAMRSGKLIKRRIMEDYGKLVELSKKDKKAFEKEVNKIKKEARAEIRFEMFGRDIKDLKSRER